MSRESRFIWERRGSAACPEPHLPWYEQNTLLSPERSEAAGWQGIPPVSHIRVSKMTGRGSRFCVNSWGTSSDLAWEEPRCSLSVCPVSNGSSQTGYNVSTVISILLMRKLRSREMNYFSFVSILPKWRLTDVCVKPSANVSNPTS